MTAETAPKPEERVRKIKAHLMELQFLIATSYSDAFDAAVDRIATTIAALPASKTGEWVTVPREIIERFPEMNQFNYTHEDACAVNDWGIELVLAASPASKGAVDAETVAISGILLEGPFPNGLFEVRVLVGSEWVTAIQDGHSHICHYVTIGGLQEAAGRAKVQFQYG